MTIAFTRVGAGEPLVLVHGIGSFRRHWEPLLPSLAQTYDVIAVDLPGFGDSPALPRDVVHAVDLAEAVGDLLDAMGVGPAHLVGHSLGGYVAFELAALRGARTVTGLAPAGLWVDHQFRGSTLMLRTSHQVAAATHPLLRPLLRAGSLVTPSWLRGAAPRELTLAAYDAYASAPGFLPVLRGAGSTPFTRGDALTMPVTVAFGSRDLVILPRDRVRDRLPAHTRWVDLPGLGHSPQWHHRALVIDFIRDATGGTRG